MITTTPAELENDFEKYLSAVRAGEEIRIVKNGEEVARIVPCDNAASSRALL